MLSLESQRYALESRCSRKDEIQEEPIATNRIVPDVLHPFTPLASELKSFEIVSLLLLK
jgi:hypothetical protein